MSNCCIRQLHLHPHRQQQRTSAPLNGIPPVPVHSQSIRCRDATAANGRKRRPEARRRRRRRDRLFSGSRHIEPCLSQTHRRRHAAVMSVMPPPLPRANGPAFPRPVFERQTLCRHCCVLCCALYFALCRRRLDDAPVGSHAVWAATSTSRRPRHFFAPQKPGRRQPACGTVHRPRGSAVRYAARRSRIE